MNYIKGCLFVVVLIALFSCKQSVSENNNAPIIASVAQKDSCDSPDANINCYFANMPKELTSTMIIVNHDPKGEKLIIPGTIYKKDKSTPYPNVILYAYHTDSNGIYSKMGDEKGVRKWHGYHHGWCKTDKNGNYRIETIRPASYPGSTNPQHIHSAVKVPGSNPIHIGDFMFKDDPLLQDKHRTIREKGGSGVIDVQKVNNQWVGKRDIILD